MSAPTFDYTPSWMSQFNDASDDFTPAPASYFYPQNSSTDARWQLYDDVAFSSSSLDQSQDSPQFTQGRSHRRALSNSTTASFTSKSPYSQATPLPYSLGFDNAYETYSNQYQDHLPTPSQTPTQDYHWHNREYAHLSKRGLNTDCKNSQQRATRAMAGASTSNGAADSSTSSQPGLEYGQLMPSTPRTEQGDDLSSGPSSATRKIPSLDRTMSDVYQDELYNPISQPLGPLPTSAQSTKNSTLLSPYRTIVNDRLQAAHDARSSKSPLGIREPSPFRQGSPFATTSTHGYGPIQTQMGSAARARQQQKAEADALAYQQHHPLQDNTEPSTISPKDAVLDYNEHPDDSKQPLFPRSAVAQVQSTDTRRRSYGPLDNSRPPTSASYAGPPTSTFSFQTPSIPASAQVPSSQNEYKYMPSHLNHRPSSSEGSVDQNPDYPAHLISMETSKSEPEGDDDGDGDGDGEDVDHDSDVEKPSGRTADGGTYTCTYQGCTQRFASPAMLQKHKREGHRTAPVPASSPVPHSPDSGSGGEQARNGQAGPHRCDRINPSTGKSCNTIFSRPYDLTRHEDTIHAQRTKVRCQYCTEEKTFSRSDALTRHMRVVHPNVDFPGKHRRRNVD